MPIDVNDLYGAIRENTARECTFVRSSSLAMSRRLLHLGPHQPYGK
jgi:hypothetical protein